MKILMTTDGSKDATTAMVTATRLLRPETHQVHILCVAPELYVARPRAKKSKSTIIREAYRKRIPRETRRIVEDARQRLRDEGWEAETLTEIGSPADVIIRMAEDYDVTVVGAPSVSEQVRTGVGPVASRVVEYAPGTVLVGRESVPTTGLRILLAVDGSSVAENALRVMTEQFNLDSAEITLIHVVETPWIRLGLDREWLDYPLDAFERADPEVRLEQALRLESQEVIDDARRLLDQLGFSASSVIREGNPATEIVGHAEAEEFDLVVLGATGAADVKHKMLGSVSTTVAWQAPCSVSVVKD